MSVLHNRRIQNFTSLFSGTIASQALNFLFYIYLSRIYSQSDFGIFSLFTSYVVLTSFITNPQLPLLCMSVRSDDEIEEIERFSEATLIFSMVAICLFYGVAYLLKSSFLDTYLLYVPIAVFFYTLTENRKVFYNQREQFRKSNLLTLIPRTSGNLLKMVLYRFKALGNGLILGEILGNSYTMFERLPKLHLGFNELILRVKKTRKFLVYNYPATLSAIALTELLPFFLISLYSIEVAGAFFLFEKFILQPFTLVGSSVGSSQAKYINQLTKTSRTSFFIKLTVIASLIFLPAMFILYFWGEEILTIITRKELFQRDMLMVLACFIPIRLLKGIIHVFHHTALNWEWGVLVRGMQVLILLSIYFICRFYSLDMYYFFLMLLVPDYLGEFVVIYKALTRDEINA